ncbi:APC family permease [Rothia uropygialis]|uniref:APC family permease n=1 Tax=Kocuria sp. 36 TaxID=1415402 RepID=UPI001EE819FA|nr:APC family permease [Kocuria sp. 36]
MTERSSRLGARHLSTGSLVFMIIAASAPLTVLAGGVPTSFAVSGRLGVPLCYLALGIILMLFAIGYGAMSGHIHNAGAFYAYITEGLGGRQGIGAAILALVSYNMMQIGLYGLFGFSFATLLSSWTGFSFPWWGAALMGWLIVGALGVNNVDLSVKVLGVLVSLEFLVVIVVCVLGLFTAPEGLSAQTIRPGDFFTHGIGVLLAFGVASFMGFESGAIYSEEAKDPRRTVSRATFIAVGIIAVFYALSSWCLAMGIGPGAINQQAAEFGPDLIFVWLSRLAPALSEISNILFVTSLLAALIAFHNAAARYFFALGRSGVLPRPLAKSGRAGAPVGGSLAQSVLALIVVVVFAFLGAGSDTGEMFPITTLFTWLTNAAAFGLVFLLAVTSVAILVWFLRNPQGHGPFTRYIAPSLATLGLGTVALLILVNFDLMIGPDNPSALVFIMPGIIIVSGVLGLIWGQVIIRRRPETGLATKGLDRVNEPSEIPLPSERNFS